MKRVKRKPAFAAMCLAVGLAVFGVTYTLLGLSKGAGGAPAQSDGERLIHAIIGDDDQKLEELLKAGVDPDAMFEGALPLQMALRGDSETNYRKVKLLLDYGANPNALDPQGGTPMHTAARFGTEPIVEALMAFGGDPHISTNKLLTPYEKAVSEGNKGAVSAIQNRFPDYTPADKEQWDSLRIGGIVTRGIKEVIDPQSRLTDAQRQAHLQRMVDKLVDEGLLDESAAAGVYQRIYQRLRETGLSQGVVK